jgi:osmotically-inducible protein OsmY
MKQYKKLGLLAGIPVLLLGMACSSHQAGANNPSFKDQVRNALDQAELKDVTVTEDRDKNTITLGGKLHSEDAKMEAAKVAQAAAGDRIVVNEVGVEPVGAESEAKSMTSNLDDGIEDNYKAALISKGLDKESIKFDAKNGVLTLKGSVKSVPQRKEAQELAQTVPNVQQVLNEIEVKR